MKKVFLLSMMCLIALAMQAQSTANDGYVDLGLPSGTLWKSKNEKGVYKTYDEAMEQFKGKLPTREHWEELKGMCDWELEDKGYKVTGPNGNSIFLPAAGHRGCDGSVEKVGSCGYYWSSTSKGSEFAWDLYFSSSGVYVDWSPRCFGESVRLVQD